MNKPDQLNTDLPWGKFENPDFTAKGETRAEVPFNALETLWFNTGTLCNIECRNCYILSSPTNDQLVYLSQAEVLTYLDEIEDGALSTSEIGFTGGEPFMNPDILTMLQSCLERGYAVLVLTNAMRPMMRPRIKAGLMALRETYGARLTMRVSLDHYTKDLHDLERGAGSYEIALKGLHWLDVNGFNIDVAGRTCWGEPEENERAGYAKLFAEIGLGIDPEDHRKLVLFPEMDEKADVPEITTACWSILGKKPADVMCASSRMVVKHKGADAPTIVACTLLPYEEEFDLGAQLVDATAPIKLNHPHCAKFCVLGGASCAVHE